MADDRNIYQRIAAVTNHIKSFEKDGTNARFNFKYAGIEQIIHKIQPVCIENGICLIQEATHEEPVTGQNGNVLERCTVYTHAINMDNPEDRVTTQMAGTGYDTLDKGIYKAESGGRKYAIFGLFNLHAGDEEPDAYQNGTGTPTTRTTRPAKPRSTATAPTTSAGGDAPSMGDRNSMRAMLFPDVGHFDGLQNSQGYDLKLIQGDENPKLAWAAKPASDGQRKALLAALSSKGYVTPQDRKFAMAGIYTAFEVPDGLRVYSSQGLKSGYAGFLIDAVNLMAHRSQVGSSVATQPEPEPEEFDLDEEDEEFLLD